MERIVVGGPFFEDFKVGDIYDDAPALTLTEGYAAMQQALCGDRLRLPLDTALSEAVMGCQRPLAHPSLVWNVAIGQTTGASQRVRANLFYRGLMLKRPVFIGDTLRTRTEVVGLKQNTKRPGKPATGLVALRMEVANQYGQPVMDFWRCPMIPLRDPEVETGHADTFDAIPASLDIADVAASVPEDWRLDVFRDRVPGAHFDDMQTGQTLVLDARDTVTSGPELARMTLNIAAVHTDASATGTGRRLVYGGHTIALALAQITRVIPNLVTVCAWRSCDHTGPVHEGDLLRAEVTIGDLHPLETGGGLVELHAITFASGDGKEESAVLDWRLIALMA